MFSTDKPGVSANMDILYCWTVGSNRVLGSEK